MNQLVAFANRAPATRPEPVQRRIFQSPCLKILAEREGGNEPSHFKKEVCEALIFSL
jgi:hypothetical protein